MTSLATSRRVKRRKAFLLTSLLCAVTALPQPAACTVILPEYNKSFPSMPAFFGSPIPPDSKLSANLKLIPSRPLLCGDEGEFWNVTSIPKTSDGLPVALLVGRGKCTFYEKALAASAWNQVQYVIVYDNKVSQQLVPMNSEHPINISLLFVSYQSGLGTWPSFLSFLRSIHLSLTMFLCLTFLTVALVQN